MHFASTFVFKQGQVYFKCVILQNMTGFIVLFLNSLRSLDSRDVSAFLIFLATFLLVFWSTRRRAGTPPGPPLLPVIGNLHFLTKKDVIGQLSSLRKTYGDIFSLYVGRELVVVLNGYDVINEALMRRGPEFSFRPVSVLNELTFIHHGFLMHNGQLWKEQRKFMKTSLQRICFRNNGEYIQELINREAFYLVNKIKTFQGAFDIEKLFNISTANVISTLMYNHRFDFEDEQIRTLLYLEKRSEKEYVEKEVCLNCLPFLSKFPIDILGISKCRNTFRRIFDWNDPYICKIKNQKISGAVNENETITDLYLKKIEESVKSKEQNTFCEDNLKGCGVDMMTAGSSTVAETLKVIVLYLIRNPEIQEKLFHEVFTLFGKDPPPYKDWKKSPYIQAVILEGIRILYVTPLALPRSVSDDTIFRGYLIPKNCTVLYNLESVMKDPDLWMNPEEFAPERFLNKSKTELSVPREFIPFSKGPRSCVGETVARIELFYFLTTLVQNFKFLPAVSGEIPEVKAEFDMLMSCGSYKTRAVVRN